ncbi:hypothetical protein Mpet_1471 [Methanolacinia petrolearia DSM 11571]|uniref:Propeptide PepSY amd peptidase M4 n=1 Tax=Methanolacinia petrolearia (strain DSM 11571 / OCM 486 / SEBR 4847) TaxID=679926 RepID=E1RFK0_METP4|nr:hypothetical protein [Methanolacinia petrolearia]ADN36230.1 hypothetical protein Mpet_1471 [Methanolacinia petrolearia DSM 11571]
MKKQQKFIVILLVALCTILVVLTAGCTYNSPNQQESTQVTPTNAVTAETTQSSQPGSTQPTVSWKDFYPDHTEQEKSQLIEEAKDEIMRVFPDIEESTLNGEWIEHTRTTDNGLKEIGSPYIRFENIKSTSDDRKHAIFVDPESMEITYYTPYSANYKEPVISLDEGKEKATEFIKNVQGEDSIVYDPDAYMVVRDSYEIDERPVASVNYFKTSSGVIYQYDYVFAEYDMSHDRIERYSNGITSPDLLSGLTTLSAEPEISFDEAVKIVEDKIAERYDLDELELEYSKISSYDNYLFWWDDDDIVYADDPNPIPLVWCVGYSDKKTREETDEEITYPRSGGFRVDAHTGEIYTLTYSSYNIRKFDER